MHINFLDCFDRLTTCSSEYKLLQLIFEIIFFLLMLGRRPKFHRHLIQVRGFTPISRLPESTQPLGGLERFTCRWWYFLLCTQILGIVTQLAPPKMGVVQGNQPLGIRICRERYARPTMHALLRYQRLHIICKNQSYLSPYTYMLTLTLASVHAASHKSYYSYT